MPNRSSRTAEWRLVLFNHNDADYQQMLREDCLETAKRHALSVRTYSAANDSAKQVEQIQACLREKELPHALLVSPVREAALLGAAYAAARAGVGWVLLGRWSAYMADLREEFPRLPIFSVAADQREIGRIQGMQFRALLPHGGEVVYIRGPLGTSSAILRFEGMQEILHGSGIKLMALSSDWTVGGGAQAMRDWLQAFRGSARPEFVVGAQNDAMAMGARSALIESWGASAGPLMGRVRFTGCDGTPRYGRKLVSEGVLAATVVMPSTSGRALNEIVAMSAGRPRPEKEIVLAPASFPEVNHLSPA
jgi:ABC-type sugar transport system substrate-binding protein